MQLSARSTYPSRNPHIRLQDYPLVLVRSVKIIPSLVLGNSSFRPSPHILPCLPPFDAPPRIVHLYPSSSRVLLEYPPFSPSGTS